MVETNNIKFRTGYIRVALRKDSMQIELLELIVLSSKEKHGEWNWQQVVAVFMRRQKWHPHS